MRSLLGATAVILITLGATLPPSAMLRAAAADPGAGNFLVTAADGVVGSPASIGASGISDAAGNPVSSGSALFTVSLGGVIITQVSAPVSNGLTPALTISGDLLTRAGTYWVAATVDGARGGSPMTLAPLSSQAQALSIRDARMGAGASAYFAVAAIDRYGNVNTSVDVFHISVLDPSGFITWNLDATPDGTGVASARLDAPMTGEPGTYTVTCAATDRYSGDLPPATGSFTVRNLTPLGGPV